MRAFCRVLWNTNHISRNTPVSARFDHATMHVKPSETLRGFKGLRDLPHSAFSALRRSGSYSLAMLGTWRLCRHLAYAHVDRTAAVLFLLTFMLLCSCVAVHELLFPISAYGRTGRHMDGRTDGPRPDQTDRQKDRQTARQAGRQTDHPSIPPSLHQSIHPSVHPSLHAHYKVVLCIYIYIYIYIHI